MKQFLTILALSLTFKVFAGITGPTSVAPGTYTYTCSNCIDDPSAVWIVTGGFAPIGSSASSIDVWFKNVGTFTVQWGVPGGTIYSTLTVTVVSIPAQPTGQSVLYNCSTASLYSTNAPPSGTTWYWQTSSGGTSTSYPGSKTISTGGTHYLRAKNAAGWSTSSASITVPNWEQDAPTPPSTTLYEYCSSGTVSATMTSNNSKDEWYTSSSGGSPVYTGSSYTVSVGAGQTKNYWVLPKTAFGCAASGRTKVTVKSYQPSVGGSMGSNEGTVCHSASVSFTSSDKLGTITNWQYREKIGSGSWSSWSSFSTSSSTTQSKTITNSSTQTMYAQVRVKVQNGVCSSANSSAKQITVYANLTSGSIGGAQSICYNGDPTTLTNASTPTGGTGRTYQWQKSTSSATSGFSDISGATSSTYDPGTLTQSTWYRRGVTSASNCGTVYTSAVKVTVYANLNAGSIGGAQTICYNGNPSALTNSSSASGGTGRVYQWQKSTTSSTSGFSDISGASNSTYDPGTLTQSTWYRRAVISASGCGTKYTGAVKVTVYGNLNAGSIGGAQTICYNGNPSAFTNSSSASGGTGIAYQWQKSTTSASSGFSNIGGATNSTYDAGTHTQSTWYRRAAISAAGCGTKYTSAVKVTVYANLSPGTIGNSQTVCYNGDPSSLTNSSSASGGNGSYTYQWQKSTNGGSSWSNISGATSSTFNSGSLTTTTKFRRRVISCSQTKYSNIATVTVQPNLNAGSIGNGQTICYGGDPSGFTNTGSASGGNSSYSYQWQKSTNGGSTWSDIGGATSSTYNSGTLTATTQFRREVTSCNQTKYTSAVTVTVRSNLNAGGISNSQTVCYGGDPSAFTSTSTASGGDGSYSYQWQISTNGGSSWSNISGATSTTYNSGAKTATTLFRRRVTSCGQTKYTGNVTVTVLPDLNAGSIGNGQTVCYGGDPSAFTNSSLPSGGDGSFSYQWQKSTNGGSSWSDISGATSSTYNSGTLTATTLFRRGVIGCGQTKYSNSVTVTVLSDLSAGGIGNGQTICYGGDPAAFTSTSSAAGGDGSYAYQWQLSTDGGSNWSNISGATGATYNSGALTNTTQFRRTAVGCNQTKYSNTITVTINNLPTVDAGADVTVYNTAANITLSGTPAGGTWSGNYVLNNTFVTSSATVGSHTVTYTYQDGNTCENSDVKVIEVLQASPITSSSSSISLGEPVVLSLPGFTVTQWYKNGEAIAGATNPTFSATGAGNYNASFVDGQGVSGSSLITTISASENNFGNYNYIVTHTIKVPDEKSRDDVEGLSSSEQAIGIQYYDGLGRPMQTVGWRQSPTQKDIIQPIVYDDLGRQSVSYLPYASGNDGAFKVNAIDPVTYSNSDQFAFYQDTNNDVVVDNYPLAQTSFEASPLSRPIAQGAPGQSWQLGSGHTITNDWRTNTASEVVQYDLNGNILVNNGYYPEDKLWVTSTTDEEGHTVLEYTNKSGQVLLKDVEGFQTYYVYDDFGQLRWVLPPRNSASSTPLNADTLDVFAFNYQYDEYRRMISKKVPGAKPVYMVYDQWDRLVLTQDGNQRNNDQWTFTAYDQLNRPVITGFLSDTRDSVALRSHVMGLTQRSLSYDSSFIHGYDTMAYPFTNIGAAGTLGEILTVSYFDNYEFAENADFENSEFNNPDEISAVETNGTNQYIALDQFYNETDSIDLLTIEAWVNTSFSGGSWTDNFAIIDFDRSEYYSFFVRGDNGQVGFSTYAAGDVDDFFSVQSVNDGEWHHLVAVFDGVDKRIYIDGELDLEKTNPHGGISLGKGTTRYGFIGDGSEATSFNGSRNNVYFQGKIGEVRLWHTPRTADQIKEYMSVELTGNEEGLQGYWTMNDMSEGLVDESGNGNEGTLVNNPTSVTELMPEGLSIQVINHPMGQLTGSKTFVPSEGTWVNSVTYYDEKLRPVQTRTNNDKDEQEVLTTYYDFTSKVIKSVQYYDKGDYALTFTEQYKYDHADRLIETYHQVNGQDEVLIAANKYNQLGQLKEKNLHVAGNSALQSLDYQYNIRGWLSKLNEADLASDGTAEYGSLDHFGMELLYDNAGTYAQYNGNIGQMTWKTSLDEAALQYGYTYDNLNRILSANYGENGTFTSNKFDVTGFSYDANGNIKSLTRRGMDQDNINTVIDQLEYFYSGNQLIKVEDVSENDFGFKDGEDLVNEYFYDENGNMTQDLNKGIDSITYNHLNLPIAVYMDTVTVLYTYDAAGVKLKKTTMTPSDTSTTSYQGPMVFEDGVLQFMQHAEGRVMPDSSNWEYQYHLKDHLGNVRLTLTSKQESYTYLATMEPEMAEYDTVVFGNVNQVRQLDVLYDHTHLVYGLGANSARLNAADGKVVGPTMTLRINAGDTARMKVYAKYTGIPASSGNPIIIADEVISGFGLSAGGESGAAYQAINTLLGGGSAFLGFSSDPDLPKAYLTYHYFDNDFNYITSGFAQVTSAADGGFEELTLELQADKQGYVYIYVGNETLDDFNVFFDDLEINHSYGPVVQKDDYYPFGGSFNSYSSGTENKYLFGGKELQSETQLYDFEARMMDPWLGRFSSIDAHTENRPWVTPYNYVQNNPITRIDPNGLDDYYYRDGKVAFVLENDKDDRYYEQRENKDNASGYETVQVQNPEANPSSLESNNETGYKYDKSDLKTRAALLSLGSGNVITAELLRREERGDFQPVTAHNYLKQVDERSARMMMFGHTMFPAPPGSARLPSNKVFSYNRMYNHVQSRALLRGVSPSEVNDALSNPLKVTEVKYDASGRPSVQYVGQKATVAVNPNTGKVITTWKTSSKLANKLSNGN